MNAATSKLDHALAHAAEGFPVFPVLPWPLGSKGSEGKTPRVKFKEWSTRDPEKIAVHWREHPDDNIGIYTGSEDAPVLVVDVDNKGSKCGDDEILRLELEGFDLPNTRTVETPTGGRHVYLRAPHPLKQGANVLGPGVDTRSRGGFVVAPGSTIDGKPYRFVNDAPMADAPSWIVDRCGVAKERNPSADVLPLAPDTDGGVAGAIEYLANHAPRNGDPDAYKVACRVKDFGVSEPVALRLMQTIWDPICEPPRSDNTVDPVRNAYRYGIDPPGVALPQADFTRVGSCLDVNDWTVRDIPAPDYLMGSLFSTTSRVQIAGPTGLGKTNFGFALAAAMAAGKDFLHWRCARPARVLYIDGEMSRSLMKQRIDDALRRIGGVPRGQLFCLCKDDVDDMPPLDIKAGQNFIDAKIAEIGEVDFIVFDNVQSLIPGNMKEEDSWAATLPWIKSLTKRRIGQLWFHHTGHDASHGYGTSTREWQLDTVGLMEKVDRAGADIVFGLKFSKTRQKTPANRQDYEPVTVVLENDAWSCSAAAAKRPSAGKPPTALAQSFFHALNDAGGTSVEAWRAMCHRRGLLDEGKPDSARSLFSQYRRELIGLEWIAVDGDAVTVFAGEQPVTFGPTFGEPRKCPESSSGESAESARK